MRRIKLTIAYDGSRYHGWQVQPDQSTIQELFQGILAGMEGSPVHVAASGRTDAGVHALAQVAAFSFHNPIPVANLRRALNRLLPHDVRVIAAEEAAADFHPRYDALAKTYEYRIVRSEICSPFERPYVHHYPYPLDVGRMEEVAAALVGTHDFSGFASADERDALGLSKVRTVFSSDLTDAGERLVYRVRGSGFLKHMVRNLVGTLLEAGKGNVSRDSLLAMLEPGYVGKGGPRVPACGLFLISVEYPAPGGERGGPY